MTSKTTVAEPLGSPSGSTWRKSFARRLLEVRQSVGMTQHELEKKAHLPATFISQCECGARVPSLENYARIVKALKTNAEYMLGLK